MTSVLLGAADQASAAQFSSVVVFGDSLSDAGYYRGLLGSLGLPASQMGRFTTNPGPMWTELISQYYGLTPAPRNAGGTIYAQGGARVALTPGDTPPGQAERPISAQISEYLSSRGGIADPGGLFTLWGGANDFFVNNTLLQSGQITVAQFQANILGAATAEVQQAGRLFQAGARHVMVFLNFDAAMTPGALLTLDAATRAGLTQLTAGANTTILTTAAGGGLRIIPVDLFSLFNEIRANPTAFGLTNVTGFACGPLPPAATTPSAFFCLAGLNVPANAQNTFLFADPTGHLSTAGNRIVFQFAQSLVEGPYNYSQLAELPLRQRTLHIQGVSEGLASAHQAELGRWTLFASGGGGNFDIDPGVGNVGGALKTEAYTLGATIRTSPGVALGAAFGQTRGRGSFGTDAGGFHTRDYNYSLFASLKWGGFYASGVGTISEIDYTDIRRNLVLGTGLRTATGSTDGSNASIAVNAGYDFALGRFRVGPTFSLTAQSVSVNAFEEAGAGAANLRIFEQKRKSEVWSAGVRASVDFEGWTPWIRVTADEERKDDVRYVTAMPLTVAATGSSYDVPAYVGDSSWITTSAGVRGWIARNVGVTLAYYKVSGRSGIGEEGASATVSVRF